MNRPDMLASPHGRRTRKLACSLLFIVIGTVGAAPIGFGAAAHRHDMKFGLWVDWTQAGVSTQPAAFNLFDSAMRYRLVFEDRARGTAQVLSWRSLMQQGLAVALPDPLSSELIFLSALR